MWKEKWGFFIRRKDTLIIVAKEWEEVQIVDGVYTPTREMRAVDTLVEYAKKISGDVNIRMTISESKKAIALEIFNVDKLTEKEIKNEFLQLLEKNFEGRQ